MKRKVLYVITVIFLIFILLLKGCINRCDKVFFNKNNIFVVSNELQKSEVINIKKNYCKKVNDFYENNNLYFGKIEDNKLYFIICKTSFNEINNEEFQVKYILNKIKQKDYKLIYGLLKEAKLNFNYSIAYYDRPIIFIRRYIGNYSKEIINSIIFEYSHHLVANNCIRNLNLYYEQDDIKLSYLYFFDEAITAFLSKIMEIQYIRYIDNNIINNYIDSFSKKKISVIGGKENVIQYIKFYSWKSYTDKDILNIFMSHILKKYGWDKLKKFINHLYNLNYTNFEKLFIEYFNISFENMILELSYN